MRIQLFIKVLRHFKNIINKKEELTKDLNCTEAILEIFNDFTKSNKIRNLILLNKNSKQFKKAVNDNPIKLSDKAGGKNNVFVYDDDQKKDLPTILMNNEGKNKPLNNITSFDISGLKGIGKFYDIYNEVKYVKANFIKIFKEVCINF